MENVKLPAQNEAESSRRRSMDFVVYFRRHLSRAELIVYSMLLAAGLVQIVIRDYFPKVHPPWPWIGGTLIVILLGIVIVPPVMYLIRRRRSRSFLEQ